MKTKKKEMKKFLQKWMKAVKEDGFISPFQDSFVYLFDQIF